MPTDERDSVEEAAHALERTIRAELEAMALATRDLAARARRLGVGARAINGLQGATATWSRDYEAIAGKLDEEVPEITKALLGKDPVPMTEIINHELAAAVAADPNRKR